MKNLLYFPAAAFLFLLCLFIYGDTLSHQFMIDERVYLDPSSIINTQYHGLTDFFIRPFDQHYVPLNLLLNKTLFYLFHAPYQFYVINLFLFYLDCCALFILINLISNDFWTAALTTALFCIHPMTGELLQHITFNIIFLQTLFMEMGLISLYLFTQKRKFIFYIFSLLMVMMGLLSQESSLIFPLYAAALLIVITDLKIKEIMGLLVPYVLLSLMLIYLWFTFVSPNLHLGGLISLHANMVPDIIANFSRLIFWYLRNLFFPKNIVFMANMQPIQDHRGIWGLIFLAFLCAAGALIFFLYKKSLESFALIIFITGFIYALPAAMIRLQTGEGWEFEPYWVYFSSFGFFLYISLLLLKCREHIGRALFVSLIAAILVSYSMVTWHINIVSRSEFTYASNWLHEFPNNPMARNIMTQYIMEDPRAVITSEFIPEVLGQLDWCISNNIPGTSDLIKRLFTYPLAPDQRRDLSYLDTAYQCKKKHGECLDQVRSIIGQGNSPEVYIRLSYTLYRSGDLDTAIQLLKQCIAHWPGNKEAYLLVGVILGNEDHYEQSISYWQKGLAIDPTDERFSSNIEEAKQLLKSAAGTRNKGFN